MDPRNLIKALHELDDNEGFQKIRLEALKEVVRKTQTEIEDRNERMRFKLEDYDFVYSI